MTTTMTKAAHWLALIVMAAVLLADATSDDSKFIYQYLDNSLYSIPLNDASAARRSDDEFEKQFPPPPLFPPPPPALQGDTNAILRGAVFNNMNANLEMIKSGKGLGDTSEIESACSKLDGQWVPNGPTSTRVVVGPPGPVGSRGPRGKRGRRGHKGKPGNDGVTGPPGPIGPRGPRGERGLRGMEGLVGPPGRPGRDGLTGFRGPAGPPGAAGKDGRVGIPGFPGIPGRPGKDGVDGLPGLVVFADESSMNGVALEGLIAYRADVKQLFFRDHLRWRSIRASYCGDGIVDRDSGETCDDANDDDHDDCVHCRLARCGDGYLHKSREQCDGEDFGQKTCAHYRHRSTGQLLCTSRCRISTARCRRGRR